MVLTGIPNKYFLNLKMNKDDHFKVHRIITLYSLRLAGEKFSLEELFSL